MSVSEEELKTHQKTIGGKRVTLDALKANIASVHVGRASDLYGLAGKEPHPLDLLTICVLVLKNGFTVIGQSACADPSMYNKEIGERLAIEDAEKKIWPLMGYNLKQELYVAQGVVGDFRERVRAEERELSDKIAKLEAFIKGNGQYARLPIKEKDHLTQQIAFMREYQEILAKRIAEF